MAGATTVVSAKTALTAQIAAITDLAGALVREGIPTDVPAETERVYVYRRVEAARRERIAQERVYQESYDLTVLIEVRTYGPDTGGTSEARAYAILNDIIAANDASPELGGTVIDSGVSGWASDTAPTDDGWITKLEVTVQAGALV
jgi:hypothetical protein